MRPVVALSRDLHAAYPSRAPFDPSERYPEFDAAGFEPAPVAEERNAVYPLLRQCFRDLGLDADRYGTASWNPLGTIVPRGGRVVLKPNFVMHEHGATRGSQCLTTHASVLRVLLDYVILAGGRDCRVVIADSPLQQADFEAILRDSGLDQVVLAARERTGADVSVLDLRRVRAVTDGRRVITSTVDLPGDPLGYAAVALGAGSRLEAISLNDARFAVTDYDRAEMERHHRAGHHEYLLSRTALDCDAFINVPKLKTHQKVGVTLALKNLVGINGSKDWLPHYRPGPPETGGDEFPERNAVSAAHSSVRAWLQGRSPRAMRGVQLLWRAYKDVFESRGLGLGAADRAAGGRILGGAWHGNDTAWRMVLDLNEAILHASSQGHFDERNNRRYLAVVDGIVGGEGDGPLSPEPRHAGLIAVSDDPVALDHVLAHVMGFEPDRIPMLREAAHGSSRPITTMATESTLDVRMHPGGPDWRTLHLGFRAAPGWKGRIERPVALEASADFVRTTG